MDISIVKAKTEHLKALAKLDAVCYPHAWPSDWYFDLHQDHDVRVALCENALVGSICGQMDEACDLWLIRLCVHPELRHRGIASALFHSLFPPDDTVIALLREDNLAGQCFLRKQGFKCRKTLKQAAKNPTVNVLRFQRDGKSMQPSLIPGGTGQLC